MTNSLQTNKRYIALALFVLLVAAGMRILGAGHSPFWSDEAWNLWAVEADFPTIITRLAANHHPPAYFFTLGAWSSLAGESKIALNFVAIAAGMLTCAVVIRLAKDGMGVFAAVAAGLIFATFEQPVYYGQSIRHYSFLLLGAALTLWLLLRALRRPSWSRFIAYGVAVAFTAYSLYIGAFLVAIQAFAGIFLWRGAWRDKAKLLSAYGLALALFTPWLIIGLSGALSKIQRGAITGYINSLPTTLDGMLTMLNIVLGGQAALGLGLIGFVAYQKQLWRRFSRPQTPVMVSLQLIGAFLLMILINARLGIISERTLAMLTPAVALTIGAGLSKITAPARGWLLGGLIVWTILTPQEILPHLNSDLVAETIAEGYSAGDLVILETGFDDAAFGYQLEATLPALDQRIFRSYYEYYFPDDNSMMAALDAQIAESERIWLVYWNVPPRMADKLAALGYHRLSREDLPVGSGDPLYERDPLVRITLWARPPVESIGLAFGDSLRLDGLTIAPQFSLGTTTLPVDLWWTPTQPIDRNYTVGLFLLDEAGVTRAESFGPAPDNPMTAWQVGQIIPVRHTFTLPPDLPAGDYTILALVYWYETPDAPLLVNGAKNVTIGRLKIIPSD